MEMHVFARMRYSSSSNSEISCNIYGGYEKRVPEGLAPLAFVIVRIYAVEGHTLLNFARNKNERAYVAYLIRQGAAE